MVTHLYIDLIIRSNLYNSFPFDCQNYTIINYVFEFIIEHTDAICLYVIAVRNDRVRNSSKTNSLFNVTCLR